MFREDGIYRDILIILFDLWKLLVFNNVNQYCQY